MNARFLIATLLLLGSSSGGPALASEGRPAYIVTNLPSLGGTVSSGNSLNDLGWASGTSNLPGDTTQHATLWLDGGRIDLGTLPGDAFSQALGINNWRQVVGISCTAGFANCRGFVWQNGIMTDLNSLVAPGYSDQIYAAGDINDLGRITGQSFNPITNDYSAFLAVAKLGNGGTASPRAGVNGRRGAAPALPDHVRQTMLRRLGLGD
jgi:probable HAF family extracellular repeat protein